MGKNIIDHIEKINMLNFMIDNILGEFFILIIFGLIFKKLFDVLKLHKSANIISQKLLKNNRPAFNGITPMYLADRYIYKFGTGMEISLFSMIIIKCTSLLFFQEVSITKACLTKN